MYNSTLLQKAAYDPGAKPLTFDEYRAAAKKVTEQGGGKAYGIILDIAQPDNFGAIVTNLARMAGAAGIGHRRHKPQDRHVQLHRRRHRRTLTLSVINCHRTEAMTARLFLGDRTDALPPRAATRQLGGDVRDVRAWNRFDDPARVATRDEGSVALRENTSRFPAHAITLLTFTL